MKKIILLTILIVFAFSCSKKEGGEKEGNKEENKEGRRSTATTVTDVAMQHRPNTQKDKKYNKKDEGKVITKTNSSSDRKKISDFAKTFEDKDMPKSGKWNKYASGFVKMVYLKFGVNLTDVENKKDEEGKWLTTTQQIYNYMEKNGKLFKDKTPKAGDIVFLDNTFDKDKDGEFNDKLTSIGIVVEFDKTDNTIYFLYKTYKGVKLKMMNLKHPEQDKIKNKNVTKTINSQMRWLTKKEKKIEGSDKFPVLSSQMLNSFGSVFK